MALESKVVRNRSLGARLSVSETEITIEAPDDEEVGYLLLRIRPCLLNNDIIFINRVRNILGCKAADQATRDYLGVFDAEYKKFIKEGTGTKWFANGRYYGEIEILNAYLNGEFFHIQNNEPRKLVETFKKAPIPFAKIAIISCIMRYLSWFKLLDRIIEYHVINPPHYI